MTQNSCHASVLLFSRSPRVRPWGPLPSHLTRLPHLLDNHRPPTQCQHPRLPLARRRQPVTCTLGCRSRSCSTRTCRPLLLPTLHSRPLHHSRPNYLTRIFGPQSPTSTDPTTSDVSSTSSPLVRRRTPRYPSTEKRRFGTRSSGGRPPRPELATQQAIPQ